MGKKGSWFAAIKKLFVSHSKSKDKPVNEPKEKDKKKNKGSHGKLRQGERKLFIPLFRGPSSIEKILADAEREHNIVFGPPSTLPPLEQAKTPPFVPPSPPWDSSPEAVSPREPSPRVASPGAPSMRVASPRAPPQHVRNHHKEISCRPEPTPKNLHASATKIQAAYRGYMARRGFRALRGLVRLQGVVGGQNVKRQTMNAIKHMHLFASVQSQIESRRIQMLENQARQQAQLKEVESSLGKWSLASEAGNREDWDVSLLSKEEVEARLQRKVEAAIKRERATAYAHFHQIRKPTPGSAQTPSMNIHSGGGYLRWSSWLKRQSNATETQRQTPKSYWFTPPRSTCEPKLSPRPPSSSTSKHSIFRFNNIDSAATPRSTRSSVLISSSKLTHTPLLSRLVPASCDPSVNNRYFRVQARGTGSPFGMKDDNNSLVSCPPFSLPHYMASTVSARAKVRANSNPRVRYPGTPTGESTGRCLSPMTHGNESLKSNRGSFFSGSNNSSSQRGKRLDRHGHQRLDSTGNLSVDSTVSLPAGAIRRKPFNRFV